MTRYTYDGIGRKLTETQVSDTFPTGVTTAYGYDAMSHITAETGAAAANELTGTTHTADITRTYDADGNLLSESTTDTTGGDKARTVSWHYDEHGLNDSTTDAAGKVTTYDHDLLGRPDSSTDPLGTTYTSSFTPDGQLAETVLEDWTGDPAGGDPRNLVVASNAYDPAGRLASTTDAMGATTAYTYYDDGLQASVTSKQVTQADGSKHDVVQEADTYDGTGNLIKSVTGGGTTTTVNTVDATGRISHSILDPDGLDRWTEFTYDGDDHVLRRKQDSQPPTSAAGAAGPTSADTSYVEDFTYDSSGNVVRSDMHEPSAESIVTSTYDQRGLPLTVVSPRGNVDGADPTAFTTHYRYDALGRQVEEADPTVAAETNGDPAADIQPSTLTGYNTFGETTDTRDPNGNLTRTVVDDLGQPVSTTMPGYTPPGGQPITAVTHAQYDALGRVSAQIDPLGREVQYGYDQFGDQTYQSVPVPHDSGLVGGQLTDQGTYTTYTPTGLPLTVTDPIGARTEATYDELGRKLTASTVDRYPATATFTSRYAWDDAGRQISSTTPSGLTTFADYDSSGELTSTTEPGGATTHMTYDALGRQSSVTDPMGRETDTAYDFRGNLTGATRSFAGTRLTSTHSDYDADGNMTASRDAENGTVSYAYDTLDRPTSQTQSVNATHAITESFGYDAVGNRTRLTDGRGNSTVFTYNAWDLPESTIEPATAAHPVAEDRTWTLGYDAAGQNTRETEPGGVIRTRGYDLAGNLTSETGTGAEAPTEERALSYDLDGRLVATGGTGFAAENAYTYNDRGQLLTSDGTGGGSAYAYDSDGRMTYRHDAAGSSSYGYDDAGRLDWTQDSVTGSQLWTEHDDDGQVSLEQYATPEGSSWNVTGQRHYGYDDLGRLTTDTLTQPGRSTVIAGTTYGYDKNDRLTSKTTTGTAGAADNTYGYDQAGRLTSWTQGPTTTAYTWDDAGNRTSAGAKTATYDQRDEQLTDGSTTYTYTARGTLSSTRTAGTTSASTFDAFDRMTSDGSTTYSHDSLDRVTRRGGTAFTYDGGSGSPVSDGTYTYSHATDGTVLAATDGSDPQWELTDAHTDVVAALAPEGNALTGSTAYDPFGSVTATTGTTSSVGFQSGWTDPTTGNVDMAARWYHPDTGTFTSRDSAPPAGQTNRYSYSNGMADPLNGTDPTGHGMGWGTITKFAVHENPWVDAADVFWSTFMAGSNSIGVDGCEQYGSCAAYEAAMPESTYDRFCDSHYWTTQCGGSGRSPYGSGSSPQGHGGGSPHGGGGGGNRGGGGGDGNGSGGGGGGGGGHSTPTAPPRPPIDQNPNNGLNPVPAPTLPPAVATFVGGATWTAGSAVTSTLTAAEAAELITDEIFVPIVDPELLPKPTDHPGGKNDGRKREDGKCDVGPGLSAKGHVVYLPRERYYDSFENHYECRATGVYGLLDGTDYNKGRKAPGSNTNSSTQPPGMREIEAQGHTSANGHLIPAALSGSGIDLRNLVAEYEKTNTPYLNYGVEADIRRSVKSGNKLLISVVPHYDRPYSGIPGSIEYNYTVMETGVAKHCVVYQSPTGGRTDGSSTCPRR